MRARPGQPVPILAASLLAVVLWLTGAAAATAHARLATSDPANGAALATMPDAVTLGFTEAVAPGSPRVSATTSLPGGSAPLTSDAIVDGTTVRIPLTGGAPDPQTVTLAWRVVSAADGHETTGLLIFSVGTGIPPAVAAASGDESPRTTSVALRAAALLGLALEASALVLRWLGTHRRQRVLALTGAVMAAAGLVADAVDRSTLGRQTGQLLVAATCLAVGVAATVSARRGLLPTALWLGAVAAVVGGGHAAGESDRLLATVFGSSHAATGLAWAGAVLALALTAWGDDPESAVRRLGPVAVAGVVALALLGVVLTAMRVDGLRSLGDLTYGRLVLAKQALLFAAVAAAAINRLTILPRLPDPAWERLARPVLAVEAAVLVGAVVVAGALASTPPAEGPRAVPVATRAIPVDLRAAAGDLTVSVDAAILGAEDDELRLSVTGPSGAPVVDVQRLIVATAVTRPGETSPTPVARVGATPVPAAPGAFTLPASALAVSGVWAIDVTVRRAGVPDQVATLTLDTAGWAFQPPRLVADAWRWPHVPPAVVVLLVVASAVLALGLLGVRRSATLEPVPALIILSAVVAITAGFAVQAIQQVTPATADAGRRPPDGALDLAAASDDYRTYCLACHGVDGGGVDDAEPLHDHGSGTNLLDADTLRLANGDLFGRISAGVPGTTMPAYDAALTESERWALIAYLRTLQRDVARPTPAP